MSQLIDYEGLVQQAVRDLIEWLEFGKAPLSNSSYTYSTDRAVTLATTAAERGHDPDGMQNISSTYLRHLKDVH
ncbi:hypothetical protein EAH80_00355 [Mycobacterium hodleri]|uniref:Uncharacterized protein n=2 Tax=Mycolicibacterium hodleri TaxID=49897 RepID=A0A502EFL4_9MYCO|nr:hypothetical protein EAH80_00355 [Mycolicibacterium hodleri]